MIHAKGRTGQARFDGERVIITRQGVLSFILQGLTGEKSIALSSISAIQFKNASWLTNGYIQFDFGGSQDAKGGIWRAIKDENTIMFTVRQQPAFNSLRVAIEKGVARNTTVPGATQSIADELEKLAALRDRGVLTEEEFQSQKRRSLTS